MRKILCIALLLNCGNIFGQTLKNPVTLPNGWKLSPVGSSKPLGDLPLNIAVSKTSKYAAVVNCGQSVQTIQLFEGKSLRFLDSLIIPKTWYGLAFSSDEKKLFVSGGNDNMIRIYSITNNKLLQQDSIILGKKWPAKISPAGIAIDDNKNILYTVTKENNSLYRIELQTKKIDSFPIGGEGYTCLLSPDNKKLYVSCWGCDKIKVFDTKELKWSAEVRVGDNPNEIIQTKNGKYLFVANANDNSVSVIDTKTFTVTETLNAALYPNAPAGTGTNGLALNAKESRLYIANADNNSVCVFDVTKPGSSVAKGFIPVGWYPTSIRFNNGKLLVANAKGYTSMANPYGPSPLGNVVRHAGDANMPAKVQYIAGLFKGTLSIINEPTDKQLKEYTTAVYRNVPYNPKQLTVAEGKINNPIPMKVGDKSPIKYVFYVIKENRTYDQVLADARGGNGDTSLLLFGRNITPNQHYLAENFVLLDNFFVDAEVSADGHNWSTGAYSTDYLEKTWPTNYGGRGGTYDAEGNRAIANNKAGFIWDHCRKYNVSYRTYGEFADDFKPNIPSLKGNFCPYYPGYNNAIKDTFRYRQWEREFDSLISKNAVRQFNTVRFSNDHTEGLRKGRPTPFAHVADNDLAVGMFIEHLSKSPIWNETAVFILEDDAQNGADHVDAHRSPAYLAGGFVKRNFVDHTPYTTSSMLRTMELILGMPPMTQYDAAATPMWRCFDTVSKPLSFRAMIPEVNLNDKNIAMNEWQRRSENFVLNKEDANPDLEFNIVLWHAIKGDKPFPGPTRSAFIFPSKSKKEDDDDD